MSTIQFALYRERPIDPQAVRSLYASVDWWPERTEEQIARVLRDDIAIGAWDAEQLVGFARVISDYCFHAYIDDVMVHPSYQHKGIGKLLMTHLIDALPHIETITLFCKSDLVPFYEQQGFRAFPSQTLLHRKGSTSSRSGI